MKSVLLIQRLTQVEQGIGFESHETLHMWVREARELALAIQQSSQEQARRNSRELGNVGPQNTPTLLRFSHGKDYR